MKNFILFMYCFLMPVLFLKAAEIDPSLLPAYIGATNSGTEFYLTFHPGTIYENEDEKLKIYVSSMYATKVTLEIPGLGIKQIQTTTPNSIITFTLSKTEGQMYIKSKKEKPLPEQIWKGRAIVITAEDPVICYAMSGQSAVSEGYLALPVCVLGTQYQVSSYTDCTNNQIEYNPSFTSIIGVFDTTKVTFVMGGCESCYVLKEKNEYLRFGQKIKRTLNKADVWLIPGIGTYNDITGSTINADKPVAVISGSYSAQIPTPVGQSAYIIEQEIPTYCWGKKYIASPLQGRKIYPLVKIFAKEPITEVSLNNIKYLNIFNAGGVLGNGYVEMRTGQFGPGETKIKSALFTSEKPINIVYYNSGTQDDNVETSPFQMQLISTEQFQKDMTFYFPVIPGSSLKNRNYLNLIYRATYQNDIPDDFMIGTEDAGHFQWKKLKDFSPDSGQTVNFTDYNGRAYSSKTLSLPGDKVYRLKADDHFGANIYGYESYNGYGMLAGGRFKDLSVQDLAVPEIKFSINANGGITGKIKDITQIKDELPSGISVVSMINALSSNFKFSHDEFIPGTNAEINFKLEKIDTYASSKAVLAFSDRCGNDTVFVFDLNSGVLPVILASNNDFGKLKSSQKAGLNFTLENNKENKTVALKTIILENDDKQFFINNNIAENTILSNGNQHNFIIKFTANELNSGEINDIEGIFTNRIGLELMNGEKIFFDSVTAEVVNPRINISDNNFNPIYLDNIFAEDKVNIVNEGRVDLLITGFEFDAESPFQFTLPLVSADNPLIIKPKGKYPIKIRFEPKETGKFNTELKVISDGYVIKNISKISATALSGNSVENSFENSDLKVKHENGMLIITSDKEFEISSVEIYDLNGKLIQRTNEKKVSNNYSVDMPNLKTGIYLVKINSDGKLLDYKIAVIK